MRKQNFRQIVPNDQKKGEFWAMTVRFYCAECTKEEVESWCKLNKMSKNEFILKAVKQALRIGIDN